MSMSLMENRPRSSSYGRKPQYYPSPICSTPTSLQYPTLPSPSSPQPHHNNHHHRNHRNHHQTRRPSKHRLSNASNTTSSSYNSYYSSTTSTASSTRSALTATFTSRPLKTFEVVFTNIVDALIFTSAIAITAYNYWMGYIVETPRLYGSSHHHGNHKANSAPASLSTIDPLKRLDIPSSDINYSSFDASSPSSPLPCSLLPVNNNSDHRHHDTHNAPNVATTTTTTTTIGSASKWSTDPWLYLKRTEKEAPEPQTQQNVSYKNKIHTVNLSDDDDDDDGDDEDNDGNENTSNALHQREEEEEAEEEDRVNRMEETLQALIRQGQAALTSPIDWQ